MKPTSRALVALTAAGALAYAAERRAVARIRNGTDRFEIDPAWQPPGEANVVTGHDGARLHAVAAGRGRPIVLSHGVMLSVHVWSQMFEPLVHHGFRVIAYDQRGHGRSVVGSGGHSVANLGRDLAAILDHFDAVDAVVLGHSMGGIAALSLLDQRLAASTRVGGVVLAGSTPVTLDPPAWLHDAVLPLERRGLIHRTLASQIHGTFLAGLGFGPRPSPAAVDATRRMLLATSGPTRMEANRALAGIDLTAALPRIRVPVLVICGDRDRIVGRGESARMGALAPNGRSVWLRGEGHMLPLEAPDRLVAEIAAFAAGLGP